MNPTAVDAIVLQNRGHFRDTFQAGRIAATGKCWRGEWTSTTIPDGPEMPDQPTQSVDPSGLTWHDALPALANQALGFRARCDEYQISDRQSRMLGIGKAGYILTVQTRHQNVTWQRSYNFGGAVSFATDWLEVPEGMENLAPAGPDKSWTAVE